MVEDRVGNLWCGTNDKGIICYQPLTGTQRVYRKNETGLGTDVVICSLMASDGSLWFGTFQGGIAHYKDGHFQIFGRLQGTCRFRGRESSPDEIHQLADIQLQGDMSLYHLSAELSMGISVV